MFYIKDNISHLLVSSCNAQPQWVKGWQELDSHLGCWDPLINLKSSLQIYFTLNKWFCFANCLLSFRKIICSMTNVPYWVCAYWLSFFLLACPQLLITCARWFQVCWSPKKAVIRLTEAARHHKPISREHLEKIRLSYKPSALSSWSWLYFAGISSIFWRTSIDAERSESRRNCDICHTNASIHGIAPVYID